MTVEDLESILFMQPIYMFLIRFYIFRFQFAIVIAFFYLIQLVRFLTIPLRTRLEETEEVRRAKRLFMMVVKALMAAG